ncbi:hypothetical protein ACSFE6_17210 [Pseudomonas baetica]|uniref:hypothetical protein n=1 Tax=Pseudomonas baetica TaxID=674054 RepID=UPI003EED4791
MRPLSNASVALERTGIAPGTNASRMTYRVSPDTLTLPSPDGLQVKSFFTQTSVS